ncbi:MAG TPA: SIMPL domain-containing protein [Terriglobales bacterium]
MQGGCLSHKIRNLVVLLSLSGGAALLHAQNAGLNFQPNTVQVSAQGKFEAEPDTAVITLTMSDKQPRQDDAYKHVSDAAERLRGLFRQNNIDPKQLRVSSYNIQPEIDWTSGKQKLIGYQVQTTASYRTRDFAQANRLLEQLSSLPYANNQSLSYVLDDVDAAKQKAIADGVSKAQAYGSTLAKASQRNLGELLSASVDTQFEPGPRPMAMAGLAMEKTARAPTEQLGQETVTVTAQVNAIFRLQ